MKGFENEMVKMEVRNGVLYSMHKAKQIITLEQVKSLITQRMEIIGDYPYPILADATQGKGATREAQLYVLEKDDEIGTPAIAIIVDSLVSRVFGNLVMGFVNKTNIDVRLFLDKEKAAKWLGRYVVEQ